MVYRVAKRVQGKSQSKPKPSLPATRPLNETTKPRVTISTSEALRRRSVKEAHGKQTRRHERLGPQHDLFLDYQDQVEVSRSELLTSSLNTLDQTHAEFTDSLAKLQILDTAFYDEIKKQRKCLLAPLAEDTIETTFTRDGKSITGTVKIGQRIEAFKALLAKKEAELSRCWAEWEKVQAKIVELGFEVLGADALGGTASDPREKKGYQKDREKMDLEHQIWLKEIEEEIRLIGQEALNKMMAAERGLNADLKREQAILIAKVFTDND